VKGVIYGKENVIIGCACGGLFVRHVFRFGPDGAASGGSETRPVERYYYYDYDYGYYYYSGDAPSFKLKTKMNKIYARLGYGIMDNWEAFVRLGGANIDVEADPFGWGTDEFDGGNGFAFGFGTKVTLYESGDLRVGALAQMSWAESDAKLCGQYTDYDDYDEWYSESWSAEAELEITEIQVAVGPAYNLMEGVLIYGGPFLHFVDGDVEGKASWNEHESDWWGWWAETSDVDVSYDIKERSCFGGYIGAQVETIKDIAIYAEWQFTGDADAVGLSAILRF